MITPTTVTPSVTINLTINERDIEYLSWTTIKWTEELQQQSLDGRFIYADRDEFVVAPIGSTVHFFFNYVEALIGFSYFTAKGVKPVLAIDESGGDWAVIIP